MSTGTGAIVRSGPTVKCPTCKGPALFAPSNAWRPFCSERCRTVDLGAWASEQFRVPGSPQDGVEPPSEPHAH